MERIRLTGKELFVCYHKGIGDTKRVEGIACTNKVVLAQRSGINYDNLVRIFTREKRHYYETEGVVIIRVYVRNIYKGGQSMKRRGRGGMEKFATYISRKPSEY
jgi:hypothetical protein